MQNVKGLSESLAFGFAVLYNATLPEKLVLSLKQNVQSCIELQWLTFSYTVALSTIILGLLIYYYVWLPINWVQDLSDGFQHINGSPYKRKTKKELVAEVQRRRQLGDLPPAYPNGWFALLDSTVLKAGQVKHVQALGENFAVMRSSMGDVYVLDAYCPHLGANMAVGGVVRGDCLECPFHGWQFRGEDGTCSHIPYSDKVPKTAVVKTWISHEVNGVVLVWYHAEGDPPSWKVQSIPDIESGNLYYRGRLELNINAHIQDINENAADLNHFNGMHSPSVFAGSDLRTCNRFIHSFLKHDWTVDWRQHQSPAESHMSTLFAQQNFRLFNKFTLFPVEFKATQIGPGFIVIRNDRNLTVLTYTPMEPLITRVVIRVYCPLHLLVFGRFLLYAQQNMVGRDVVVWNYKKYMMKPKLAKEDDAIARHRRWFSQFYTANSPRWPFKQSSTMEW